MKNTVPVEHTIVDMKTGEAKTETRDFALLPCAPDVCQECATKHEPEMPHDKQSLYYQYKFYGENDKRWPTWADAMAHCSDEMKAAWTKGPD